MPSHTHQLKEVDEGMDEGSKDGGPPKRGQKGKMKKREKYRDQDEEERNMRMSLLQVCVCVCVCVCVWCVFGMCVFNHGRIVCSMSCKNNVRYGLPHLLFTHPTILLQSAGSNKENKKGKAGKKGGKEGKGKGPPPTRAGPKNVSGPKNVPKPSPDAPNTQTTAVKKEERPAENNEEEEEEEAMQVCKYLDSVFIFCFIFICPLFTLIVVICYHIHFIEGFSFM